MVANSENSGEFYTILLIIWQPRQPWVCLHMEVQIYYAQDLVFLEKFETNLPVCSGSKQTPKEKETHICWEKLMIPFMDAP